MMQSYPLRPAYGGDTLSEAILRNPKYDMKILFNIGRVYLSNLGEDGQEFNQSYNELNDLHVAQVAFINLFRQLLSL